MDDIKMARFEMYEGETRDVVFRVSDNFPIAGFAARLRVVRKGDGEVLKQWDSVDGTLVVVGQDVLCHFAAADTDGREGIYCWQLMFYNADHAVGDPDDSRAKTMRGVLVLNKSYVS